MRSAARSLGMAISIFPESFVGATSRPDAQTLTGQEKEPVQVTTTLEPRCPPAGKRCDKVGGAAETWPVAKRRPMVIVTQRKPCVAGAIRNDLRMSLLRVTSV